jgi:putative endonuclease
MAPPRTPFPSAAPNERQRRYRRGHAAELLAAGLLVAKGYRILARRYATPLGEIDIVAARGRRIAFVEVKARQSRLACEAAITPALALRVRSAASLWLKRNPRYQNREQGYDVVFVVTWHWPQHIPNGL